MSIDSNLAAATNLTAVGGAAVTLGQKVMSASVPVVIASDQSNLPVAQFGSWTVAVSNFPATQPVSGTVTANQGGAPWSQNLTQIGGAALSEGQKAMAASIPVVVASDQSAIPISGTVTTSPPANASTNLAQVGGAAISEGQKAMAASVPVVIASDQSAVPVSGTVTTTPPANASTNVAQFGGTNVSTGTGAGGAGIPRVTISNDSSLAANQSVNVNQVGGAALTEGQKAMAASVPVTIASDQSTVPVSGTVAVNNFPATQPVSGTVTANQGGAPWSVKPDGAVWTINGTSANVNVTNALSAAITGPVTIANLPLTATGGLNVDATLQGVDLGPAEMGQSLPVTLALDQPPILVDGSQVTQPISAVALPPVAVSNFPVTQPVSAVALPLPGNAVQESGGNVALLTQLISIQMMMLAEMRGLRIQFANQTSGGDYPDANDLVDSTLQLN